MEDEQISGGPNETTGKQRTGHPIRRALVFGGLILAVSAAAKYAVKRGVVHDPDLSLRLVMAMTGAFLASIGNLMPKTLTPLSAMRCDSAKAQTFRRVAGWTWVLAGLALAIGWLVLPMARAQQMTTLLIPTAIVIIAVMLIRLLRTRPTGA